MKPTEKQKCIAEQAVYGDLRLYKKNARLVDFYTFDPNNPKENDKAERCGFLVGLRPLSDLTKEITHKGYNNDEPFIPADIINKMELGTYAINLGQDSLRPRRHIKENDLLHLWHFDTRNLIATGEAIDVNTLDVNHYSVKL